MAERRSLTQSRLRDVLTYDLETGIFVWRIGGRKRRCGCRAGCVSKSDGHLFIGVDGHTYGAHVLAFLYVTGNWPNQQIDHINLIKTDNRWCNLREATASENGGNKPLMSTNTSGIKGVFWNKNSRVWWSQIGINGRLIYLGSFGQDKEAAATAYAAAADRYFGEFARAA